VLHLHVTRAIPATHVILARLPAILATLAIRALPVIRATHAILATQVHRTHGLATLAAHAILATLALRKAKAENPRSGIAKPYVWHARDSRPVLSGGGVNRGNILAMFPLFLDVRKLIAESNRQSTTDGVCEINRSVF